MDHREDYKPLRHGWCLGDGNFKQELLAQMEERRGKWHSARNCAKARKKAECLVKTARREGGWKESDLPRRPKGDPVKVKMALQLREQTVMTMEWIANRLQMGTRTHLNHLLYWHRRGKTPKAK